MCCLVAFSPSNASPSPIAVESDLHSPQRQLIELRIAHADLDARIDSLAPGSALDELTLRRLKKQRLALRDQLAQLERELTPREPA
jgi:hypothetical protein